MQRTGACVIKATRAGSREDNEINRGLSTVTSITYDVGASVCVKLR